MTTEPFKTCSMCGVEWVSREDFLRDPDVALVGYQVSFGELRAGLFLFNHACRATLALEVGCFVDLYDGPVFEERREGGEACPGHCMHSSDLRPCPVKCECAFVREVIRIIVDFKTKNR